MSDVRPMPAVTVRTGGQDREVTSVEITRQIPGTRASLGVQGGMLAHTADVTMPEQADTTGRAKASPWDRTDGFPPRKNDPITITINGQPRFAGQVGGVDGGVDGPVTVEGVEGGFLALDRSVTFDPVTDPQPVERNHNRPRDAPWANLVSTNLHSNDAATRIIPDATFHFGTMFGPVTALPYVEPTPLLDLLQQVATARGASVWFDRNGQLMFADADVLLARAPVATITADADILDLSWRDDDTDHYHQVHVVTGHPNITLKNRPAILLWEGPRHTFEEVGESATDIATPGSGVDWLMLDVDESAITANIARAGRARSLLNERAGVSTIVGGARYDPDDDGRDELSAPPSTLQIGIEQITSQAIKFTHTALSFPGSFLHAMQTRWHVRSPDPWGASNLSSPRLRGFGKIEWETSTCTGNTTGPTDLPDLTHDAGPWVQGGDCQTLANHLAERLTQRSITLDDIPIVYRQDIDLGDVITLVEDVVYDITLRCLVIGLRERHTPTEGAQMWLTLRVLDTSDIANPRGRRTFGTVTVVPNYNGSESPDPDLDLVGGDLVAPAPVGWSSANGGALYYSRTRDALALRILSDDGWGTMTATPNPGSTTGPATYLTEIVDSTADATLTIGAQGTAPTSSEAFHIPAGGGTMRWIRDNGYNTGSNIRPIRFPSAADADAVIGETFYFPAQAMRWEHVERA